MNKNDEYQKQAADAQAMADRAASTTNREAWRRIAQGWLSLIRKPKAPAPEGTAQPSSDHAVRDRGTARTTSKESSH